MVVQDKTINIFNSAGLLMFAVKNRCCLYTSMTKPFLFYLVSKLWSIPSKKLRHKRIDKSANFIWFSFEWSIRTKVFSFFKVCFFKLCMQLSFNFFAPEDQSRLNQIFRNIHISYNLLYQLKCLIFRSNYMVFINSRTIITSRSEYRDA